MTAHAEQTERIDQKTADPVRARGTAAFQFVDRRVAATAQRRAQTLADNSPKAAQLKAMQQTSQGDPVVQAMKIRGGGLALPTVSKTTSDKHVVADGAQAAAAAANYGSTTFVRSDAAMTAAVNADNHDFLEAANIASARFDFNANVVIDQFDKTGPAPGGLAKNQAVNKTIDNTATNCEIGVKKGGDDQLKVIHFKKN